MPAKLSNGEAHEKAAMSAGHGVYNSPKFWPLFNYGNTEFLLDTRILVRGVPTLFSRLEVRVIACPQDKSPPSIRNTSMLLISKCRLIGSADSLILSVYGSGCSSTANSTEDRKWQPSA
jgi:hypothetical protein